MKVIFDFDDVIFNTKAFKMFFTQLLEERGYKNVMKIYDTARIQGKEEGKPFSLREFISRVDPEIVGEKQEALYQEIIGICEHIVNAEIIELIKDTGSENCFIITNGTLSDQIDKIKRSIGDLVPEKNIIVVTGSKKDEVASICGRYSNEEIIFVDDKQEYFNDLDMKRCKNLKTVLFNENGVNNLLAEIDESRKMETQRNNESNRNFPGSIFGMH